MNLLALSEAVTGFTQVTHVQSKCVFTKLGKGVTETEGILVITHEYTKGKFTYAQTNVIKSPINLHNVRE